jgi:hypothetical protein
MPRKILGYNGLADFFAYQQKQGIAVLQMKGLTEEEKNRELKKAFKEIADFGYPHIHTLRDRVPQDGREPYYVHVDNVERE